MKAIKQLLDALFSESIGCELIITHTISPLNEAPLSVDPEAARLSGQLNSDVLRRFFKIQMVVRVQTIKCGNPRSHISKKSSFSSNAKYITHEI